MSSISIADVNALTRADFMARFGDVAEHSPWVAESANLARPFATREDFIAALLAAVAAAPRDDQLALLRAHPDLAGKAARAGDLTRDSQSEQAGAGLGSLSAEEFSNFSALNDGYKVTFGFPFIYAVKGATKSMIIAAFEERILNAFETEYATALAQVGQIIRFRIEDRVLP